ncbi:MAG TPA: TlpA family protein disulfide reductase [Candidatus Alistipes intestinipullorum]|nr:TlpA family protein disulfide reductase [Candidatus Alistipes intestinipullorum]
MKKLLLLLPVAAFGLLVASCGPRERVVEDPLIEASNSTTLDIVKVSLCDTATVLDIEAWYTPHFWIRIDHGTYLQAGKRKYALTGAEGITPDSLFWMPDSGRASFRLTFEPLPRRTCSFDFIESDCDDCFKLYGIDLTGKATYETPRDLPSDVLVEPTDNAFCEPLFEIGETTVRMHFIGYREGLGKRAELYVNTMFGTQKSYTAEVDPATSMATFRFDQYGTAFAFGGLGRFPAAHFWTAPGETIEVYADLRCSGESLVSRRRDAAIALRTCYTNGTYAEINASPAYGGFVSMNLRSGEFADYRMTADEYVTMVCDKYRTLADSIARSSAPAAAQRLQLTALRQETLAAFAEAPSLLEHNYRHVHNQWDYRSPIDYRVATLEPRHYAEVCKLFDINDPTLLVGDRTMDYVCAVCAPTVDWPAIAGLTEGIVPDLRTISGSEMLLKVENNALTDEDFATLHAMKNPFYAEAFEAMQARVRETLAEAEGKAVIEPTPDVPLAELFDAIVAPYRGKVILVDFWNTWCGPCRAAIESIEPVKGGELKSDDLVWLYIANETSPIVTYKTMIPKIAGKHFRLNKEQWSYLCEKFGIDGIPSYVVVDRDGSYRLRNDLRDHASLVSTLRSKLE